MASEVSFCAAGGESITFIGDVPGSNVIIKIPLTDDELEKAIEETQMIEVLYDWTDCEQFLVNVREELIIVGK